MRRTINKILLGTLAVACASCTGDYIDINSNPYQPGNLAPDDYGLSSAMNNLAGCVVSPDVNTAQFTDCVLGGPLGGYFADSKASGWDNTISNYNPTDNWTNVFLKSDKVLPVLYTNLTVAEKLCGEAGDMTPMAVAKIIKVAAMSRVTDTYGPIPYTQIGKDGSITTPYDSQEKVYDTFFSELADAVKALGDALAADPDYRMAATADYVYQGDLNKWMKFANSLRLRLAMRIVYRNQAKAEQVFKDVFEGGAESVITTNDENAKWNYFSSINNPLYVASRYNQAADCVTGGDSHAAADIICYMNGYNDPRREKYFVQSEWPGRPYVGVRRGIELTTLAGTARKYSGINVLIDDPIYWMNAAEVSFLCAEAVGVFNFSFSGAKTAQAYYEDGIRLSFEQYGVELGNYLENTNVPKGYSDPDGKNSYDQSVSSITVKWNPSASKDEMQERIITQKWIANWMLGNEAWADYRRTGYPHLIPATEAGNKSGGEVDSETGPRRMRYPVDEYVSNKENIEEAVAKYLNGPDKMSTAVWWDNKPRN